MIHPTADVSAEAFIGKDTQIWHQVQIREGVHIGTNCIIGKGVFIDTQVTIGNNVKIQNYVSVYHGVEIEDGVFIGPHVCFTNDKHPRAINPDGSLKSANDWTVSYTKIKMGASIGANSTILSGISIGVWSLIGAGSLVTKSVPDFGLTFGNPSRLKGFVCPCGHQLKLESRHEDNVLARCSHCGRVQEIPEKIWKMAL